MSYALAVRIRIQPEHIDDFMARLAVNAAAARLEPGCLGFDVLVDPADRSRVMLYEVYKDEAAFQSHQATQPFKDYMAGAVPLLAERERQFLTRVSH